MTRSRRNVLQTMAGLLSSGIIGESIAKPTKTFDTPIKDQRQVVDHNTQMSESNYLTLPGVSFSSLLYNINNLPNHATIYMDHQDWARLRYQVSDQPNYSKLQRLGMVYGELFRQGTIQTVDYASLYSSKRQDQLIRQNQEIVSSASDEDLRRAARGASEGFINYSLSPDQDTYRKSLANLEKYRGHRSLIRDHSKKIDHGRGHPDVWTERLLNRYAAASTVSTNLSQKLGEPVKCLGQGESSALADLLDNDNNVFGTQFCELGDNRKTRHVFDQISKISREVTKVDEKHWFLLGPRMVVPHHSERFDQAWSQMRFGSEDKVVEETRTILDRLEGGAEEEAQSMEFLEEEVKWLIEENNLDQHEKQRLMSQLNSEIALSHKSKEIAEIVDNENFTPAASFLAATIQVDPLYRYQEDDLYRRAVALKKKIKLDKPHKLEKFKSRGGFRRGDPDETGDWPQMINRSRTPA